MERLMDSPHTTEMCTHEKSLYMSHMEEVMQGWLRLGECGDWESIVANFRRGKEGRGRNYAGALLPVIQLFGCDICLFAVSSITPAWTRRDRLVEEIEEEEEEEEAEAEEEGEGKQIR